ncbi:uncharacterized protein M6B38_413230 [Iris pallida]|uniref:CW-type domain-containing protein n=1 Tax=Iris pallida TaxID=29817 RepID=A0AAX6FLX7_IRIPA|nr:uncharacterized protein M6B38_413230 [Iris pallida]
MLSVRSREGLGFGGGGERRRGAVEMEENELEEGEACSGQEDDSCVDPDVALSYIDEKIQDVLGHFQKDFEGGVSAENLGAKFGGYGSFLPTYQRSPPILIQPRSSPLPANRAISRSPCNSAVEGVRQNPPIATNVSLSRNNTASTAQVNNSGTMSAKQPNNLSRKENFTSSPSAGRCIPQHDLSNEPMNSSDQKSLKLRLKVGLPKDNAAIYYGLGLDDSPSSSLEGSPDGSGGIFPKFQDAAGESPVTILQVMTCFSVPGGYLLSPLHEHLIHLSEKTSSFRMSGKPRKGVPEISIAANSTLPTRDLKVYSDKKAKSNEKNGMSSEESLNCKTEASKMLEKEIDIETPAGQKLLASALNIPVFSNLRDSDAKVEKQAVPAPVMATSKTSNVAKDPDKTPIKDKISLTDIPHDDQLASTESLKSWGLGNSENESTHSKGKLNSKIHLVDKAQERRPVSNYKDGSSDSLREIKSKTQRSDDVSKFSYDGCKDTDNIAGHTGSIKLVSSLRANSHEKDEVKKFQALDQVHKGKDKQKRKHNNYVPTDESTKENLRAPSSVVSKEKKKSSHSLGGDRSEKKSKIPKSRKEMSRSHSREPQGELARIIDDERVENMTKFPGPSMFTEERPGIKKDDNIGISEQLANAPILAPSIGSGPTSDAAPVLHAPVLIKENWVQCDTCMKWRLLPYGADPDNLPKEWECNMQIWLPGLNSCIISEEETQKAFNELYLVPAPGTGANLNGHHDVAASSITSADALHIDQRREHTVGNMPTAGKKKYRPMGTSNLPNHSSSKKNLHAPFKNKRSSDVNEYPRESSSLTKTAGVRSKSIELTTESHNHRQKKNKIPGRYSDGGDSVAKNDKHSKSKSKREVDQDGVRTSKKFKKEVAHILVEDRISDLDMACKAAPIVDNGLSSTANGNFLQNYCDQSSSKDSKCETKGNLLASIKRSKDSAHVPSGQFKEHNAPAAEKSGTSDFAAKKRKLKEWQESKAHQDNLMSSQQISDSRHTVKEAFSESELSKQKKAKVAMPEGKEPTMSDTDGKMDKKGNLTKILLSGSRKRADEEERVTPGKEPMGHYQENVPSRRALDGTDSSKLYGQLPAAATSSSSKVSGSRKNKAIIQEVKGSPVESVSSSPLRIPNIEKVATKSYSVVKDDVVDVGLSLNGSPKRSDGEVDGGSDQSGTQRKETGASGRQRSLGGHRASDSGIVGSLRANCSYQDKEAIYGGKGRETLYLKRGKQIDISSTEFVETNLACDTGNAFAQSNNYHSEGLERDDLHNEDKLQQKSGKSSSLCSRERNKSSNTDADRVKLKVNDSGGGKKDLYSIKSVNNCQSEDDFNCDENSNYQEDVRGENCKFEEKDENYLGKKNSSMKRPHVNGRGNYSNKEIEDNLDAGNNHSGSKATLAGSSCKSSCQENLQLAPYPTEQLSGFPDHIDRSEMFSGIGISQSIQPSKDKQESRSELHPINVANKSKKPDNQNGKHAHSLRQATPNGHDSASPMRKDGPAAAHVLKEARDLKHTANRLKKEGLEHESIGIFFESALKFLHYASLLEPSGAENARQGELKHMMHMYSETAKLCMYCAHEYERCKEMAAAALAYKCVEVAYMKAAYYKHPGASKDRHELQTALQTSLPGESPSSSASDVDNLNNQGALDKAASTKAVGSPQIAGNYVIAARNRPHFMGLLNYTNDLISAFEATKRSQSTISAASVNLDKVRCDGLSSVREVLDFNYHNVEGLLRLVRRSMALISR